MIPYKDRKEGKKKQVRLMFNHIANRYDFLNHFFSFGMDKYWQKKSVKILKKVIPKEPKVLDLATGTGNLITNLLDLNPEKIIGADIAENMLDIARTKFTDHPQKNLISFQEEDAENLTFEDNYFDLVTIAYGVRNFENIPKGISEIYRVLKPDGYIAILELTTPTHFPMKQFYRFYSKVIIPFFGRLISKDKGAYDYLPNSVKEFSEMINLKKELEVQGFIEPKLKTMTFGIVTLFYGKK